MAGYLVIDLPIRRQKQEVVPKNEIFEDYGDIPKHPSQYRCKDMGSLVIDLVNEFKKPGDVVNTELVVELVRATHIFRIDQVGDFWTFPVYRVNKKKLRATVKRIMARCKIKSSLVHQGEQSPWNTDHAKWDNSLDDFVMDNDQIVKEEREIGIQIDREEN